MIIDMLSLILIWLPLHLCRRLDPRNLFPSPPRIECPIGALCRACLLNQRTSHGLRVQLKKFTLKMMQFEKFLKCSVIVSFTWWCEHVTRGGIFPFACKKFICWFLPYSTFIVIAFKRSQFRIHREISLSLFFCRKGFSLCVPWP